MQLKGSPSNNNFSSQIASYQVHKVISTQFYHYVEEKQTLQLWNYTGGSGQIPRCFDKFCKSFVISLLEPDMKLTYPKPNIILDNQSSGSPTNSQNFNSSLSLGFQGGRQKKINFLFSSD
ncbi:UNKNOWN [Stylonychia lemnae]|uniref:Uncharacterized protein n=1 Tax=Stylonychia lemnae TaxID=5949 RepID=A0A078ABP0_STYLE|nr:UNKNOWN [Stylonychia lemnae]|eukprot:CDW78198.1 UNKNOWN [Stylonychia lemnae]